MDLLVNLPYSRKHETEADDGGYDMMSRAGYNPGGLADVFRLLQAQSKGGKPPEFLSDHPADANRIRRIETKISADRRTFPPMTPLSWGR